MEDEKEVGIFLKFCLKHKEVLVRKKKLKKKNGKMVFKRETFVSHPEDNKDPLKNFRQGSDITTGHGC